MKRSKKALLLTALSLITVGILVFLGSMYALGFDFGALKAGRIEQKTYPVSEAFSNIAIDSYTAHISLEKSTDGSCKVICSETKNLAHSVSVENGTLCISTRRSTHWYDLFNFAIDETKITVLLPESDYSSLSIGSNTGDVNIPADFTFESITANGKTGSFNCFASVSGELNIAAGTGRINIDAVEAGKVRLSATTGDIYISSSVINSALEIRVSTGNIHLNDVRCASFNSDTTTGNVLLSNVTASDSFEIKSTTGDIRFDSCDAGSITVRTSTGDIIGTLLSDKIFLVDTSSGSVSVPKTITGGKCEITSETGDVVIDIE